MRLDQYLEDFGSTVSNIARKANLNPMTVRNILNEKKDVLLSTALSIENATKGQVTCREMLPRTLLSQLLEGQIYVKKKTASQKSLDPKKKNKKQKNKKKL